MQVHKLVAIILIAIAVSACQKPESKQSWETAPIVQPAQSQAGRYQIVFSPHLRADTYLIDTEKGRVWQHAEFSDMPGKPTAWSEVEVIDSSGEIGMKFEDFRKIYSSSSDKKKPFSFEEAKSAK